jgi:hypothetical protein
MKTTMNSNGDKPEHSLQWANSSGLCASTLEPDDEALLAGLAHEVAKLGGKAVSHSAVFRALLRLARDFDSALLVRLVGLMEREGNADEQGE